MGASGWYPLTKVQRHAETFEHSMRARVLMYSALKFGFCFRADRKHMPHWSGAKSLAFLDESFSQVMKLSQELSHSTGGCSGPCNLGGSGCGCQNQWDPILG